MARILTIPAGKRAKFVVAIVFFLVTAVVGGLFSGKFEDAQENETASFLPGKFESAMDEIRGRVSGEKGGLTVKVTGAAGYGADAIKVFGNINGTLLGVAALIVLILLVIIYRSPIFWAIPFFTVLLAESSARGFGYLIAEAGVTINGQSGGILPVLVFGAGTDYALLLVSRYREELR